MDEKYFSNGNYAHAYCRVKHKGVLKQTFEIRKDWVEGTYSISANSTGEHGDYEYICEVDDINDIEWAIEGYCKFDPTDSTEFFPISGYNDEYYNQVYIKKLLDEESEIIEENNYEYQNNNEKKETLKEELTKNENLQNHSFLVPINIIYCRNCGVTPGPNAPKCTYSSAHSFVETKDIVFCRNCGVTPSPNAPQCSYSSAHSFKETKEFVYCRNCGVTPSPNAPKCTYSSAHSFKETDTR